jgi:hypothetical protein
MGSRSADSSAGVPRSDLLSDEDLRERRRNDPELQQHLKEALADVEKAMRDPHDRATVTAEDLPAFLREFN